jgi:hypothetical protein
VFDGIKYSNEGKLRLCSLHYVDAIKICMFIIIIIITLTYAQVSSVRLILKLLRHVSVLIHHLQGVYSCVS